MKTIIARAIVTYLSLVFIGLFFACPGYAIIDPGSVIGIWLLDNDRDAVAVDSAGNGHDGEIIGDVELADGKFSKGFNFAGSLGNYVKVPHDESLNLTEFTITYWCKMGVTGAWQIPVAKVASGAVRNVDFQTPVAGGTVGIYFSQGASQWRGATATTVVSDEQWHHIAGSYDLENLRIYVDGVMEGEVKHKGNPDLVDGPLTFGEMENLYPFEGILDDIGVFSKALSLDDIVSIMNNGLDKTLSLTAVSLKTRLTSTWAEIRIGD